MHDDYKPLDTPQGVERCPVCGSEASLWQYSESETTPRQLLVCCTHGDLIGPQSGLKNEGCLLYMPPDTFYRETIRDAVRYWNEFAKALVALRDTPAGVAVPREPLPLEVLVECLTDESGAEYCVSIAMDRAKVRSKWGRSEAKAEKLAATIRDAFGVAVPREGQQ